jgi:hypothetical protein
LNPSEARGIVAHIFISVKVRTLRRGDGNTLHDLTTEPAQAPPKLNGEIIVLVASERVPAVITEEPRRITSNEYTVIATERGRRT